MRTWILQRFQVYGRVCLIAAVFLMPAFFHRGTADVFNLVKISILWFFGVLALAFWASWSAERKVWPPRFNLLIAAGIFLAAMTLTTLLSQSPRVSLIGLYHRYGGLIPFLLYAAVMVTIVGLYWERPTALREIARASAAASMVLGAYVLIQAAGWDWINWLDPSGKPPEFPVGTMGNSNFAGAYLGIGVPFLMYVARSARRQVWQTALTVVVGLDVLAVWYTQTRGGMIAAGAGLLTMGVLYWDKIPRWVKGGMVASTAAGVIVAGLVLFSDKPPEPLANVQTLRTGTFTIRTYYWGSAWRIFKDNPITGTGPETYFANYPRYRAPADGAQLGLTLTDKPHNIYLEYAANSGILGIGSYLALVGLGLWYGYSTQRKLEGQYRMLLVAFVATLTGYLAQGFFSIDVPPLAVMGWIALAGIAAIADPKVLAAREQLEAEAARTRPRGKQKKTPQKQAAAPVRGGPARWAFQAPVFAAAIALLALGMRPVIADALAKRAQELQARNEPPAVVEGKYLEAAEMFPLEPAYVNFAASIAATQAEQAGDPAAKRQMFQRALDHFNEARRINPGSVFNLLNIARVHTGLGELDPGHYAVANQWWKRVVAADPVDWQVREQYAVMLNAWANATQNREARQKSAEQLETITRLRPSEIGAWINLAKIRRSLGNEESAKRAIEQALEIDPSNAEAKNLLAGDAPPAQVPAG